MPLLLAALFLASCHLDEGVDLQDGGGHDGRLEDGEGEGGSDGSAADDAAGEAGAEDSGPPEPGSITMVAQTIEVVSERICDLDGDGQADNSVANLGEPWRTAFASVLSVSFESNIDRGDRWIIHLPWVDDGARPNDPEARLLAFNGVDEERCTTPYRDHFEDDFSGEEPFCARFEALDGCGEPLQPPGRASIQRGELQGEMGSIVLGWKPSLLLRDVRVTGRVGPWGSTADLVFCGYLTAAECGDEDWPGATNGLSLLEGMLAGGVAFGVPNLPGLTLDIDVDGDGLEHFELDGEHHISRCIDGDATVIEGRDCWQDERMSDALSLTLAVTAVSGVFQGAREGWDQRDCSAILDDVDSCPDDQCIPMLLDDVCPENAEVFEALLECESCGEACLHVEEGCRACAETGCPTELAACLDAAPCCPVTPEPSAWDPS